MICLERFIKQFFVEDSILFPIGYHAYREVFSCRGLRFLMEKLSVGLIYFEVEALV